MVDRLAEEVFQFGQSFFEHFLGFGLDIQSQKRLGVAGAHVKPPVLELDCHAVQIVYLPFAVLCVRSFITVLFLPQN